VRRAGQGDAPSVAVRQPAVADREGKGAVSEDVEVQPWLPDPSVAQALAPAGESAATICV
jgi:hypothetical protein